jgi:hypothetical protein
VLHAMRSCQAPEVIQLSLVKDMDEKRRGIPAREGGAMGNIRARRTCTFFGLFGGNLLPARIVLTADAVFAPRRAFRVTHRLVRLNLSTGVMKPVFPTDIRRFVRSHSFRTEER